jgi:hypothetical protein
MVKVHKEIIYKLREFEPKTYELSLQKHSFPFPKGLRHETFRAFGLSK